MSLSYLYIALTIALTVYGQLMLKWRVGLLVQKGIGLLSPQGLFQLFTDIWVLSAFGAAFAASLAWMMAISDMPLSKAYPFMALNFVVVLGLAAVLYQEAFTLPKVLGTALIVLGVIVVAQSRA